METGHKLLVMDKAHPEVREAVEALLSIGEDAIEELCNPHLLGLGAETTGFLQLMVYTPACFLFMGTCVKSTKAM